MIKAVVFDMDDTLYPEREYLISGFKKISDFFYVEYGINGVAEVLLELFDTDKKRVYERFLDKIGKINDNDLLAKMIEIYRENKPAELHFFNDVLPLFSRLKKNHIKIGVITDGRVDGQQNKVDALSLSTYAECIILTEKFGGEIYRKPHPISFINMAQKLEIDYTEMLYVGDNPVKDFAISEVLPIKTVEIERDRKIHDCKDYLKGIKPHYKIKSMYEIDSIIGSLK